MTDQKTRWANRAARRTEWAQAAIAKADAVVANHGETDWAWATQPGHFPARARQIAQTHRSFEMRQKAEAHLAKARELERMATTNKGDAEAGRQVVRDGMDAVKVGDTIQTILYGPREVLRVNKKTFTVKGSFGPMTVDKAHCKAP